MKFLALILFVFTAFAALAEKKKYGSFILNTEIPDTLFFVDEIKANDSFELRKACPAPNRPAQILIQPAYLCNARESVRDLYVDAWNGLWSDD